MVKKVHWWKMISALDSALMTNSIFTCSLMKVKNSPIWSCALCSKIVCLKITTCYHDVPKIHSLRIFRHSEAVTSKFLRKCFLFTYNSNESWTDSCTEIWHQKPRPFKDLPIESIEPCVYNLVVTEHIFNLEEMFTRIFNHTLLCYP